MKKILIYIVTLFCIVFIIPSICTKKKKVQDPRTKNTDNQEAEAEAQAQAQAQDYKQYDYKKFSNIKLYHSKTGVVEELPIDEYLYGVVSSEIPASYNLEALKAQAVASRTYTIYQIANSKEKHTGADICDDSSCCQAWISKEERLTRWDEGKATSNWDKITTAVNSTQGQIITYKREPIDAFFHSNSGGVTETASNVWGGTNLPYLQSVETAGEEGYSQYLSEVELTKEELIEKLKVKYKDIKINFDEENNIQITEYTESGRVRTVKFGNVEVSGTEARTIFGLKSTNFQIEITENTLKFTVTGYGHGVGMSQTGADSLANQGYNYEQILKHFYTDVEITYINEL